MYGDNDDANKSCFHSDENKRYVNDLAIKKNFYVICKNW